jgi:hypothetical protein
MNASLEEVQAVDAVVRQCIGEVESSRCVEEEQQGEINITQCRDRNNTVERNVEHYTSLLLDEDNNNPMFTAVAETREALADISAEIDMKEDAAEQGIFNTPDARNSGTSSLKYPECSAAADEIRTSTANSHPSYTAEQLDEIRQVGYVGCLRDEELELMGAHETELDVLYEAMDNSPFTTKVGNVHYQCSFSADGNNKRCLYVIDRNAPPSCTASSVASPYGEQFRQTTYGADAQILGLEFHKLGFADEAILSVQIGGRLTFVTIPTGGISYFMGGDTFHNLFQKPTYFDKWWRHREMVNIYLKAKEEYEALADVVDERDSKPSVGATTACAGSTEGRVVLWPLASARTLLQLVDKRGGLQ